MAVPIDEEISSRGRDSALVPTVRQMLALWLPLAASTVMMVLEPSAINVALGRTVEPEFALAAYGVAFSVAVVVEAPIMMLVDASVGLANDRRAFALIRRFGLLLGLVVTAVGLLISMTPLYSVIVENLMRIPRDIAVRAQPTLQILSFWSLPIGWRRAHQGVLIRGGHTRPIIVATGVRLATLVACLIGGLLLVPELGAEVAGSAMVVSVVVEAALVTQATRPLLQSAAIGRTGSQDPSGPLTFQRLWRFYWPLIVTTFLRQLARPMLNAGIAMASLARTSLAAWPVVWGFAVLIAGPVWSLQQVTNALSAEPAALPRVRRFVLGLGTAFAFLLALIAFSPVYGWVMGGVYNLSNELQQVARPSLWLLVPLPLLLAVESYFCGVLIRGGHTGAVRTAMTINVAVLALTVFVGSRFFSPTGVILAAVATLTGAIAELVWLRREFGV